MRKNQHKGRDGTTWLGATGRGKLERSGKKQDALLVVTGRPAVL